MKTTTISDTIVQEVSVAARRRTDQRQGASARANFAAERNQAACDAPNLSVHLCGKPLDGEGLAERDLAHCARTVRQALWLALGIARGLGRCRLRRRRRIGRGKRIHQGFIELLLDMLLVPLRRVRAPRSSR
jgi:hypothetical protein